MKGSQVMSFRLLLFVLATVSSGGGQQATLCQVYPSNYTFTTGHIENLMTIDLSRCTANTAFTTCQHPSTLTDSITGGDTFNTVNTEDYLVWKSTNRFSRLLFTFPTEIVLEFVRLYYYIDNQELNNAIIRLEFYAVPDEFMLGGNTPDSTSILNASLMSTSSPLSKTFSLRSTMTRKLLVTKSNEFYRFAASEVEFYTVSSDSESPTTTSSSTTTSGVTDSSNYSNTHTSSTATTNTDTSSSETTHTDTSSFETTNTDTSSSETTNTDTSSFETTNTDTSSSETTNNETSSQVPPTPSITNKDSSTPVEYIAAAVVAVILAIAGLIVMVIVIMACKRKRNSVKDKDFKGSDPDLYDSPKIKLSPLTGQVESPPSSKATTDKPVEANDDPGGVQATYAVVNKQKKKKRKQGNQSSNPPDIPQPYQQATPTESHDTAHDTYAVVDMTKKKNRKKKKKDSHLDSERDPPPVPEHTIDQLYAVVQKKPKKKPKKKQEEIPTTDEDTDAPPVPAHTMEEL